MTLSLQPLWRNQALDLGSLGLWLGLLLTFLGWNRSSNDVLCKIIILGQVEQLSDLSGSFGSQSTRYNSISQPRDIIISFLYNNQVENRQI